MQEAEYHGQKKEKEEKRTGERLFMKVLALPIFYCFGLHLQLQLHT